MRSVSNIVYYSYLFFFFLSIPYEVVHWMIITMTCVLAKSSTLGKFDLQRFKLNFGLLACGMNSQ